MNQYYPQSRLRFVCILAAAIQSNHMLELCYQRTSSFTLQSFPGREFLHKLPCCLQFTQVKTDMRIHMKTKRIMRNRKMCFVLGVRILRENAA